MKKMLIRAAQYWEAWNRVYSGQVQHEDEPYPVEQVRSEQSFNALRGRRSEVEPLSKAEGEGGIHTIQPQLHQPF